MPDGSAALASVRRGIAALHGDPLTGLRTRGAFMRALRRDLSGPADRLTGVLFVDVDGLKRVNDTLGHDGGDEVLSEVATRLGRAVGRGDLLARVGGDEFAVLVRGRRTTRAVVDVAHDLIAGLAGPSPAVTASIGVAVRSASSERRPREADELVRCADLAMLRAKHRGGGHVQVYSPGMADDPVDRTGTGCTPAALVYALEHESFSLRYQPAYCVGCGEAVRVEALLRVLGPHGCVLVPGRLLALAEATGRLDRITAWVLARALHDASDWWARGHRVPVAVNIGAGELAQPSSTGEVLAVLRRSSLPTSALVLEVHHDGPRVPVQALVAGATGLSAAGVGVVAEDVDTDWPLAALAAIAPDVITLAQPATLGAAARTAAAATAQALLLLAEATRSSVTAKGVETETQLSAAVRLGCTQAQGDLLGPVTTPEAVAWRTSRLTMRDTVGPVLTDVDRLATVHACTTAFSYADRALAENQRSRDPSSPSGPGGFSRPRAHFDATEES